jgi:hypothetical protein
VFLTRPPRDSPEGEPVRLACIRHAASVDPEPGSNSPPKYQPRRPARRPCGEAMVRCLLFESSGQAFDSGSCDFVFALRPATVSGAAPQGRNVTFTFASSSTRYSNDLEATNGSQPGRRGNLDLRAGHQSIPAFARQLVNVLGDSSIHSAPLARPATTKVKPEDVASPPHRRKLKLRCPKGVSSR